MSGSVNRSPALLPEQRGTTCSDSRGGRQSVQSAYGAESAAGGRVICICTISCLEERNFIFYSLQDARRATELEEVMEKQKMKVDLKLESSTLWPAAGRKEFRWGVLLLALSSLEWTLALFWLEDMKTSLESFRVMMLNYKLSKISS